MVARAPCPPSPGEAWSPHQLGSPPPDGMWCLDDFELGPKLGAGNFAQVRLLRERSSGVLVAVKQVSKRRVARLRARTCVERELSLQAHLCHESVLQLFGYFWDRHYIYLLLEYAPRGDLGSLLRRRGSLGDAGAVAARQAVAALRYLHGLAVIHRDLKPENLLVGRGGAVKLADFGWAVQSQPGERRWTVCGTLDYLAPEMVRATGHGLEVDLWGLGVLAYELFVGSTPFFAKSQEETYRCILKARFTFPPAAGRAVRDFVQGFLEPEPFRRRCLEEAAEHEWLSQGDSVWESLVAEPGATWSRNSLEPTETR
mmetsp:Transcript_55651/g.124186  ORF Transcript_55651/g.124186 Transcript_55651/m.124186 type:complete len:314 (-) Transcript_55651:14-955(-)